MSDLTPEQKTKILEEFENNPNIIDITKIVFNDELGTSCFTLIL